MKWLYLFIIVLHVKAIQQGRRRRRNYSNLLKCYSGKYLLSQEPFFKNNKCISCPINTYRPDSLHIQTKCITCQAGRVTNKVESVYCIGNICKAGKYGSIGSTICIACPPGKYSSLGSFECKKCESGKYNPLSNQEKCIGVSCEAGFYGTSGLVSLSLVTCHLCPKGKFSLKGSEDCTDCPLETFSYDDGAKECFEHRKCKIGYYTDNYYNHKQKTCKRCYLASGLHLASFIFSVSSTILFLICGCCNCPKNRYILLFIIPGFILSCLNGVCGNTPASKKIIYSSFGILGGLLLYIIVKLVNNNCKQIFTNCITSMIIIMTDVNIQMERVVTIFQEAIQQPQQHG